MGAHGDGTMTSKAARITRKVLEDHYHMPMSEVAKKFEVCLTYFKKVCRRHGVKRWPYRQVKSIEKRHAGDDFELTPEQYQRAQNFAATGMARSDLLHAAVRSSGTSPGTSPPRSSDSDGDLTRTDHESTSSQLGKRCRGGTSAMDVLAFVAGLGTEGIDTVAEENDVDDEGGPEGEPQDNKRVKIEGKHEESPGPQGTTNVQRPTHDTAGVTSMPALVEDAETQAMMHSVGLVQRICAN